MLAPTAAVDIEAEHVENRETEASAVEHFFISPTVNSRQPVTN